MNITISENQSREDRSQHCSKGHLCQGSEAPNVILASIETNIISIMNEFCEVVERWTQFASVSHGEDGGSFKIIVCVGIITGKIRSNMIGGAAVFSSESSASKSISGVAGLEVIVLSVLVVIAGEDHVS